MNKFYKVGFDQYVKDIGGDSDLEQEYNDIKLPKRATVCSAGYDFFAPFSFTVEPGEDIKFPTGIKIELDQDKFLACIPRSGLGFKYKLQLANTIGIIDSDYILATNEGHIHVKLCNNGTKRVEINKGDAFMQGIILPYFKTDDDDSNGVRVGGLGSTGS